VKGDKLYGRGAADMKGGVAAIIAAAEHLVANDAPVRPVLALVADEEDASLGSEAVIAALPRLGIRPDVCLIAEPYRPDP
jgi:acetylornithine deacetylase